MRKGAYEGAVAAFRAARKASPGSAVEQARLLHKDAVALLRMGRYPQALRRLSQALAMLEKNAAACTELKNIEGKIRTTRFARAAATLLSTCS